MEVFARVVEAKSFSQAAQRLGISKSVVSKQVTLLEKSLGVRLLNRTTRRLSLTEVGAAFYERCAHILSEAEEAELLATRLHSEPRGRLKVSVPVAFGVLHVAPALADFLAPYPELRIDMTFNDRSVDLAEEGYDAAVYIVAEPDPKLAGKPLAPIRRKVCGTPEYFRRHGVPQTPDALREHNCLAYSYSQPQSEWSFRGPDGDVKVAIAGSLRANNENALRHAALGGLGLALLPTFIVGEDVQRGALQIALPEYSAAEACLFVAYLPNRHLSTKVRAFVDFLAARFERAPYWDRT